MKKFAKMSLVAAVAVAGLTSYSSAASLEEAIKDSSISGYLRYRFNTDHETDNAETTNADKLVVVTKTKVNDNITATTKWAAEFTNTSGNVPLTQLYFTYANGPLAVNVGRAPLVSPMTDNANQGDGIVATYNAGPITLAGAFYNSVLNANDTTAVMVGDNPATTDVEAADSTYTVSSPNVLSSNVYGVGILGSIEMVNFAAWYLDAQDEYNLNDNGGLDYSVYSLEADATVGPVSAYAFYADGDDDSSDEISFLKTGLGASFGIVSANLDFIKTGEQSGDTTLDGDTDAAANFGYLTIDTMLINDLDAWNVSASVKATDEITLGAGYLFGEDGADAEVNELHLQAKYQMSKNFYVLGRYSVGEDETGDIVTGNNGDFTNSRIELKYSF